jgi:hypothetical protein
LLLDVAGGGGGGGGGDDMVTLLSKYCTSRIKYMLIEFGKKERTYQRPE